MTPWWMCLQLFLGSMIGTPNHFPPCGALFKVAVVGPTGEYLAICGSSQVLHVLVTIFGL